MHISAGNICFDKIVCLGIIYIDANKMFPLVPKLFVCVLATIIDIWSG